MEHSSDWKGMTTGTVAHSTSPMLTMKTNQYARTGVQDGVVQAVCQKCSEIWEHTKMSPQMRKPGVDRQEAWQQDDKRRIYKRTSFSFFAQTERRHVSRGRHQNEIQLDIVLSPVMGTKRFSRELLRSLYRQIKPESRNDKINRSDKTDMKMRRRQNEICMTSFPACFRSQTRTYHVWFDHVSSNNTDSGKSVWKLPVLRTIRNQVKEWKTQRSFICYSWILMCSCICGPEKKYEASCGESAKRTAKEGIWNFQE